MSLEDIPQAFADYFDINLLSGQVILSIALIFTCLLPAILLTKGKNPTLYLMIFLLVECLLVGLGWLNFWVLIITIVVLVIGMSQNSARIVTGGG